ncbi:lytic transglycosylase domain-containing protein [Achromobacter insuavis]|uniref:lytic transglycosylase domain-containing protein n=1 Tax=Achromobacter insuavis TaxID=1287735 RepID=UPI003B9951CA
MASFDDLHRLVMQAESQGRDFDASGNVLTSPVGAKGRMQVMDATNRDPGYGVRPAADDSLEERARVGKDYLQAMLGNYGGDVRKALAAYNAGPGNVDRAIEKGGDSWMTYLPKPQETVPYIDKIVAGLSPKSGVMDKIASAVLPSAQAAPAAGISSKIQTARDAGYSDEEIYQHLSKSSDFSQKLEQAKAAGYTPDEIYSHLGLKAPAPAAVSSAPGYRVEMSQEDAQRMQSTPQHTGVLGAIESLGAGVRKMGEGIAQGFGDVPAGLGQSATHEGQKILGYIDKLAGTDLAQRVQPEVAARDAEAAKREADYQAQTPGSVAAGAGRVAGNLGFSMMGGPAALSTPVTTGAQLGAKLLPSSPRLGALLGSSVGSSLLGAGYGATAPVTGGDYNEQSARNATIGAILGAATPAVGQAVGATGRYIGRNIQAAIAPFTESGRQNIAQNLLAQLAQKGPQKGNVTQFVPGVEPTMAEITGNPNVANLQRTMRDVNPVPFVVREEANSLARQDALGAMRGTADDLAAAVKARSEAASNDYLNTHVGIPVANTEYAALKKSPAFQSAFAEAERMAKNTGSSVETRVANRTNANRGGQLGAPETYVSGVGLQRIKSALDDQISSASSAGERAKAANILQVKDKLLELMDREIPGYADARAAFASASRDIDAMKYLQGLNLTDAQGNITLAKVQNALRNLGKAQMKPGLNDAKSVTPAQVDVLTNIRDDLLRQAQTQAGRSLGSNTAQNLAMQNMLANLLPGKAADVAGSIGPGAIAGGGLGFLMGGPAGAAAGAVVGNRLGAATTGLMRASNEDIQNRLSQLLLNEGGSGVSALQRAASSPRPLPGLGALERLLYPAVSAGGSLGLGVKTPAGAR